MIYRFLKRPQESDNPLLKFTKYQRGIIYEMYRSFGVGELYNGKYFLYNSMNQSERRQIFLGKDDKNKTFICFDTECKKPIIYVSLLKDATNLQGQKTTLLKVLQYVDPTFNSAPKNLVPIN